MVKRLPLTRLLSAFGAERSRIEATIQSRMKTAEAADVLQDTWLKLAQRGADGAIDDPAAFVRSVARNTALDYLRKDRRRRSIDAEIRELLFDAEDALSPERILIGREAADMLAAAIDALPEQTRRVFVMNRFEGKTHREIAAELRISDSAVYYHIRRALEHLSGLRQHLPD